MKKLIIVILSFLVFIGVIILVFKFDYKKDQQQIFSFEDCLNAGFSLMESYPRQCRTPDGKLFAEEITPPITYNNSSKDLIEVELPFPGAVTGKEFKVVGYARGYWFFEASFPVEVLDKNGSRLFIGPAQAKENWMTENFVPFEITVKVPETYIGPATLVLMKDNPSGDRSKDASISFPIVIEY